MKSLERRSAVLPKIPLHRTLKIVEAPWTCRKFVKTANASGSPKVWLSRSFSFSALMFYEQFLGKSMMFFFIYFGNYFKLKFYLSIKFHVYFVLIIALLIKCIFSFVVIFIFFYLFTYAHSIFPLLNFRWLDYSSEE